MKVINYKLLKDTINNCPIYESKNGTDYIIINKELVLEMANCMEISLNIRFPTDTNKENQK